MPERLEVTGAERDRSIERAAEVLRAGELVVLPTDTTYGLAADAFSLDGTARIVTATRRPRHVPLPVFVRSPKQLLGLTSAVPTSAERLMAAFWPGPLTIVLPAEPSLRWDLGRTEGTVAVRMPLDEVALDVIRGVGPIAVTSANRSGHKPPPTTVAEVMDRLGDAVTIYLDDGPRAGVRPSTIVDLTRGKPSILRSGALPDDRVLAVADGRLDPLEAAAQTEIEKPPGDGGAAEG
jgi:L-threonylcarbamoyladenylate synthase